MPIEGSEATILTRRKKWDTGDPDAWDKAWYHPRLLMWNRLDLRYYYDDVYSVAPTPIYPTLSTHKNPSSAVPHTPVGNLIAPYRLGKPFIFRGQFTFSDGVATKSELGKNRLGYIDEDAGGGGAGSQSVDMGNVVFQDPADAAGVLETKIAALINGTVTVTYEDPRRGSTLFAFKVVTSIDTKFVKDGNNALWETFGLATETSFGTTHVGDRILHEREFMIWDTGAAASQRGGGPHFRMGEYETGLGSHVPVWFVLTDCNFDDVTNNDQAAGYDTWSWGESGGAPKLALYGSNTLADLEEDWLNSAKFVEGVNLFTFCRYYWAGANNYDNWPDNPFAILRTYGRCWGSDASGAGIRPGGSSVSGGILNAFPCRYLVAHLWKWQWYVGETQWPLSTGSPPNYRYWMLLAVNRHNATGRLAIGGPVWLDPGWIPWTAPGLQYEDALVDRSRWLENEFGDRLPVEETAFRRVSMQWRGGQRLDAMDHALLNEGLLRPRAGFRSGYPTLHNYRTVRGKIGGRASPVIYIDPLYDASGDRTTLKEGDPYGDWAGQGAYAPRYNSTDDPGTDATDGEKPGPPQRLNWENDESPTYPEGAGYDSSLYARGTIYGYATWGGFRETGLPDKSYHGKLVVEEIPED